LKGLSLNELCFVVASGIAAGAVSGMLLGLITGFMAILMIAGIFTGGLIGYFVFSRVLVRLKGDAPAGLLKKRAVIVLAHYGLVQSPYRHYKGVWRTSRKIKG